MPNGGSDCCGTCWFNRRNRGERGIHHRRGDNEQQPHCQIRDLAIDDPFYTYCANHPHRRPEPDPLPIGPVTQYAGDGMTNDRRIWMPSPDSEKIRQHLLDLLTDEVEKLREENLGVSYPIGPDILEVVVWQLGEFREQRAEDHIEWIHQNCPSLFGNLTEVALVRIRGMDLPGSTVEELLRELKSPPNPRLSSGSSKRQGARRKSKKRIERLTKQSSNRRRSSVKITPVSKDRPIRNSYWIKRGRLAAGEYPGHKTSLRATDKVLTLLKSGIDHFIDLTEPGELKPYARMVKEESRRLGLDVVWERHPIVDRSVPQSLGEMSKILDAIDSALQKNKTVYVHCWGGVGRTGTTVGCWLVRHGQTGEEALSRIAEWWQGMEKIILSTPDRRKPGNRENTSDPGWNPSPALPAAPGARPDSRSAGAKGPGEQRNRVRALPPRRGEGGGIRSHCGRLSDPAGAVQQPQVIAHVVVLEVDILQVTPPL